MKKLNLLLSSTLIALPFLSHQKAWGMDDQIEPAIHILERKINFIPGSFNVEKDNESLFTIPHQPKEPPTQTVKIYSGQPQEMTTESVLMRVNLTQ